MDWHIDIDARDLLCPLPVLRLRKRLGQIAPGEIARLETTDPMALIDVPHFCAEAGHRLLDAQTEGAVTTFLIQKSAQGTAPAP